VEACGQIKHARSAKAGAINEIPEGEWVFAKTRRDRNRRQIEQVHEIRIETKIGVEPERSTPTLRNSVDEASRARGSSRSSVPGEPVVDKPGKGAFHATDLDAMLKNRGITQLIVCGVTTEVCVNTTVREANDRGYECLVVEDCVGSYFPKFQEMGLRMIKAQGGIFGWVASSEAVIAALLKSGS
jgi:hypothetical protein